jgi:hypothetical protein
VTARVQLVGGPENTRGCCRACLGAAHRAPTRHPRTVRRCSACSARYAGARRLCVGTRRSPTPSCRHHHRRQLPEPPTPPAFVEDQRVASGRAHAPSRGMMTASRAESLIRPIAVPLTSLGQVSLTIEQPSAGITSARQPRRVEQPCHSITSA